MRRILVLLSLTAAAAGTFAVPAAHANSVCVSAWTEGSVLPNAGPYFACSDVYPYGVYCERDSVFLWPQAAVTVESCTPGVI